MPEGKPKTLYVRNYKHGYAKKGQVHPLYKAWEDMKQRCLNPNNKHFHDYGGRGISICGEWLHDSKAFIEWGLANSWKPGLQIDRLQASLCGAHPRTEVHR
jgi:hypothetical protein